MTKKYLDSRNLYRIEAKLLSEIGMVDENHLLEAGQAIHQLRVRVAELETRHQWRPMGRCPKDKTVILARWGINELGKDECYWAISGHIDTEESDWMYADLEDEYFDPFLWREPTHWMPLFKSEDYKVLHDQSFSGVLDDGVIK